MWEQYNIKCSEEDEPQHLFRGLCSKIDQDRKMEVVVAKSFKLPAARSYQYQQEPRCKPYDTKREKNLNQIQQPTKEIW